MKLSIITVNLNNAAGLRKTIESVVSQTFRDFEYIVIDGGSTDGSVDVIKQYADKITYWVSEPDTGIYNAMNKGIVKAQGEYLQFLNSGDLLHDSSVLEKVFKHSNHVDIITGDLLKQFSDNKSELDKGQAYLRVKSNQSLTLNDMFIGTLNHSASFIRKNLFEKYGLYDENYKIVSDWIFFLKTIGLNGAQVEYVDIIVAIFDMGGISVNNQTLLNEERQRGLIEYIPKQILADYKLSNDYLSEYKQLRKRYDYLFHYRFIYQVTRVLNRLFRSFRSND